MKHLLTAIPLWVCCAASAQNADSAQFYYKAGMMEKGAKRYLAATQLLEKAISFSPSNVSLLIETGLTYQEMKKTDHAKALFTKVNELEPKNREAIEQLMEINFNYRQFAKAIEFAQKCTGCDNALHILGMSNYGTENYPEAEKYLNATLKKNPDDAEAAYTLARTYLDMEEYNKSLPWYEKATKMEGAKAVWMYELGLLYYNQSDYKKATASFINAANNGYTQSSDFNENLGFASLYSGEYEKGEKLLLDIYTKKPGDKDLLRSMAEILYQQKQYDKSLSYCQKLMQMDEKDGKALYQAGLNFQKKGEKDRGQQMCDKAI
jgi:tetratricopeptide (TPR) repeat protein